jgi:general nucleoside transport system permease protein
MNDEATPLAPEVLLASVEAPVETPVEAATPAGLRMLRRVLPDSPRSLLLVVRRLGWWVVAYAAALVIFGVFVETIHVSAIPMYRAMWDQTIGSGYGIGQALDLAGVFILSAMAVAVPARAGLTNIGGEGQVVMGLTAAGGVTIALGPHVTGLPAMILMALAAAAAGAAWAAIAGLLKLAAGVNEAISTLLLNYVAADVLSYLVYGPWQSAQGNGQPVSAAMPSADFLPSLPGLQAHIGIVIAVALTVVVALVLSRTTWGFSLRTVGGNQAAARRAGLRVAALTFSAMLVGGALAGLGGMIQYAGLEGQLRPGLAATFGYTGFLASWLARHRPSRVIIAAAVLALLSVAGDALEISSGLSGGAVDVLMAIILFVVLGKKDKKESSGAAK